MRLFAILFVFAAMLASAQTFLVVEQYETFERSTETRGNTATTDLWLQQSIKGRLGAFVWAQAGRGYQQTYAGPSLKITDWLEAGIGGGVEHGDFEGRKRLGSFVYAAKGSDSLFGVYENGASGRWFIAVYGHRFNKWLSLGMHAQDYEGIGPRLEITKGGITVWTSCLVEKEAGRRGTNFFAGAKYSFNWPKAN